MAVRAVTSAGAACPATGAAGTARSGVSTGAAGATRARSSPTFGAKDDEPAQRSDNHDRGKDDATLLSRFALRVVMRKKIDTAESYGSQQEA